MGHYEYQEDYSAGGTEHTCPVCNAKDSFMMGNKLHHLEDDDYYRIWDCKKCGANGEAFYKMGFDGHENIQVYKEEAPSMDKNRRIHAIVKFEDLDASLTEEQRGEFLSMLSRVEKYRQSQGKSKMNNYYVCNVDEPYSDSVYEAIKTGEESK